MNLFCVGLSHHNAEVEVREQFAATEESLCVLRENGCAEALVLITCNRVEVYGASEKHVSTLDIAHCLSRRTNPALRQDGATARRVSLEAAPFYRYEGPQCVRHLFRVASGLDSMVVGETEVLGQAKKAYETARASSAAGPYLHRLFQRAFRAAKHVRTHTDITRGAVSVGSVAVDLAARIFGPLANCKVLLLGAGENSERTARALVSRGVTNLLVSNRSVERAEELVASVGGSVLPFDRWLEHCRGIDILITSTAAEQHLLTRHLFDPIWRERVDRPLFIIDIAVPRNVDPGINDLPGVYLYDMDALQSVADQALAVRREQVAAAEEIIAVHVQEFLDAIARGLRRRGQSPDHRALGTSTAS